MTPRYRRKLFRDFSIGLLQATACIYFVSRDGISLWIGIWIIATIGYFIIIGFQIALNRCPHCHCLIDLRELDINCPKCGVWLPGKQSTSVVHKNKFVKFTSHLNNSFVAPSQWTTTDHGDTFSLKSPDGLAIIHAIMFTAQGSGSLNEFRETMASGLLPKGATGWVPSDWLPMKFGERGGQKIALIPIPGSHQQWRLYVMGNGKFYHAIILNASNELMTLNGSFYEDIIRTFHGV